MENRSNSHDDVSEPSSDVKFIIDDVEIPANKKILSASSPYFRAMFGNFRERDQDTVKMTGISSEIFKLIIHYVCTSEVQISDENVQDLLSGANLLECTDLCNACINFLKGELHPMNCIGILNYAELNGFPSLYNQAKNFILQNFIEVTKYEEFLNLSLKEISEIISSDMLNVPEEKVFESVLIWVRHDLGLRHPHLLLLMKSIRICCMPMSYIKKTLLTEPLLQIHPKLEDFVSESLEPFRARGDPKTITDKCGQFRGPPKILLVIGGTDEKCIDCFDFKKGTWSKMGDIPCRNLRGAAVTVIDGIAHILGTCGEYRALAYNSATDRWNSRQGLQSFMALYSAVTLGNHIYAVGMACHELVQTTIVKIDSKTGYYTVIRPMISRRGNAGIGVVNDLLYMVGGYHGISVHDSAECYNPISDTWEYVGDMHSKRMFVGVGVMHGILYAVGGDNGTEPLKSVEAFDPKTGYWTMISDMQEPRRSPAVVTINNLLYAIGGQNNEHNALDSMEVYDPFTNIWTLLPNRMSVRRYHSLAAVIDMPDRMK